MKFQFLFSFIYEFENISIDYYNLIYSKDIKKQKILMKLY